MRQSFKTELFRKSVHLGAVFLIPILHWNFPLYLGLLLALLVLYPTVEYLQKKGFRTPLVSEVIDRAKRRQETRRVALGAIYLACAALICPLLFGAKLATIGLLQLFIADAAASLIGRKFGIKRLPYSPDKTIMGTLAFFIVAFLISLPFVPFHKAMILGLVGALVESLPMPDLDNLTIPLIVSSTALFLGV